MCSSLLGNVHDVFLRERTIGSIRKYHQAKKSDAEKRKKKTGAVRWWGYGISRSPSYPSSTADGTIGARVFQFYFNWPQKTLFLFPPVDTTSEYKRDGHLGRCWKDHRYMMLRNVAISWALCCIHIPKRARRLCIFLIFLLLLREFFKRLVCFFGSSRRPPFSIYINRRFGQKPHHHHHSFYIYYRYYIS